MDDVLAINIKIAERLYPMKVQRRDEENIRKAAKMINERILLYQERYKGKDKQDVLAMAALDFTIQVLSLTDKQDIHPIISQLEEMNEELSKYLTTA